MAMCAKDTVVLNGQKVLVPELAEARSLCVDAFLVFRIFLRGGEPNRKKGS